MKIFFDTNIYVAESLNGRAARAAIAATRSARWRIYTTQHVLDELDRVLRTYIGLSARAVAVAREQVELRSVLIPMQSSRHIVPDDRADDTILQAALIAGADYLVTNDRHLVSLDPY